MNFWNDIINTALLGTDKRQLTLAEVPADLQPSANLIAAVEGTDKEEQFLQLAAVAFNYRRSGISPVNISPSFPEADAESWPVCSSAALQVLKSLLTEDNTALLTLWLQRCTDSHHLLSPEYIPALLEKAATGKSIQPLVSAVCGRRGEWLGRLNPAWNFAVSSPDSEDIWQTGTPEQRKAWLRQLRSSDRAKARQLLQETWDQENANSKVELLKQLSGTVEAGDHSFLIDRLNEKSQKVAEEALRLLQQSPTSIIVEKYWEYVSRSVTLKKEKALLGLVNKTALQVTGTMIPEGISTIERLSNDKSFPDDEFVTRQLIAAVPPANWEQHLGATPEEIIGHFIRDTPKYLPALLDAIVQFRDQRWAMVAALHSDTFHVGLLPLLPPSEQTRYSLRFITQYPDLIITFVRNMNREWSLDLSKAVLTHTAKEPYRYNLSFYKEIIPRLPAAIIPELPQCSPKEDHFRVIWANNSDQVSRLIDLKEQTLKAFNV